MSDAGSEIADVPVAEVEEVEVAAVEDKSGPMSVEDALQEVIKTALVHDGLARGLREATKALDKKEAHLCVLVETVTEGELLLARGIALPTVSSC
jgi:small subunit ribosomal protein S12e